MIVVDLIEEPGTSVRLESFGYWVTHDLELAPDQAGAECTENGFVVPDPETGSPERFGAASCRKLANGGT